MGVFKSKRQNGETLNAINGERKLYDDPIHFLSAYIVIGAVEDWRELIYKRVWEDPNYTPQKDCNFEEMRLFFKSEWCDYLMQDFDLNPLDVLKLLEQELAEAMATPATKKQRRGTRGYF